METRSQVRGGAKDMKCWICGDKATKTRHLGLYGLPREVSERDRCYCDKCKAKIDEEEKAENELYIRLKHKRMYERACVILENQNANIYDYKEAMEVVEDHIKEHPDKFDSAYEVLAAIILVKNRIVTKMQYKIGRYQVDFLLPELKIILEIDGDRHKHRVEFDTKRDAAIKREIGLDWDIIRIKTEYLDMNAIKLTEALYKVHKYHKTGHINWKEA